MPTTTALRPPKNGVLVRMYRQGHGDCFLLALPREREEDPFYVLIDCGFKPGSQADFIPCKNINEVVQDIAAATNHHLDLVIITHEHQDHLNGFWKEQKPYFHNFQIDEAWFAWTEDPTDELAKELRRRHHDQLLGLVEARRNLALAAGEESTAVRQLDSLLSFELGGGGETLSMAEMRAAAESPSKSVNKQGMKLIKDKAAKKRGVRYLSPGGEPLPLGETSIRAFVLGPPRSENLLEDEDPVGGEGFPGHGLSFMAAAKVAAAQGPAISPFAKEFGVPVSQALTESFFQGHYGAKGEGEDDTDKTEVSANASWRRIDDEWLYSAESLALKLNSGINNTSLVLAFELPGSKKILLFAGDAQRGNWISWDDQTWQDGDKEVTAKQILGRTVLYKVGHHGSHNATLAGRVTDRYPNLSWMGKNRFAGEFTAMITAVSEWAMTRNNPPWRHPLPSIRKALLEKAQGRVFQTDVAQPERPENVSEGIWKAFLDRSTFHDIYFDYTVLDE